MKEFVCSQILFDTNPAPMIRHGSYPRRRKIKNIIKSVKKEVRHSKINQQNVMAHTEKWGGGGGECKYLFHDKVCRY